MSYLDCCLALGDVLDLVKKSRLLIQGRNEMRVGVLEGSAPKAKLAVAEGGHSFAVFGRAQAEGRAKRVMVHSATKMGHPGQHWLGARGRLGTGAAR